MTVFDMNKARLPRWAWLMVGLFLAVLGSNLLNLLVLVDVGEHIVLVIVGDVVGAC